MSTLAVTNRPRYLLCAAFSGAIIEEMPMTGVTFELGMNAAGQFQGTLNLEDPALREMDYLAATAVTKTCTFVDINGSLAWGGVNVGTNYDLAKPSLTVSAQEHYWYFSQRLQAQDYSTQWASTPASSSTIAATVMGDALSVDGSLPLTLIEEGSAPTDFQIPFSAPISQRLSVAMIVGELSGMGYQVGYDFASDPIYVAGIPVPQLTISYPRRGNTVPDPPLVMDVSDALGFTYNVDGTQQANGIVEMLSGSGGISGEAFAEGPLEEGWPLLEAIGSHSSMSSIPVPDSVVEAFLIGDLALRAYPLTVATITYPLFNDPAYPDGGGNYPTWGDWRVGDDVLLQFPPSAAFPTNPRFPTGLVFYFRIVKAAIKIADQGISIVTFTLNVPPLTSPVMPPGLG